MEDHEVKMRQRRKRRRSRRKRKMKISEVKKNVFITYIFILLINLLLN